MMRKKPVVVALDVIETTFSLARLGLRFEEVGLPSDDLDLWFARSLRDFFALSATGTFRPFPEVLKANLSAVGQRRGRDLSPNDLQTVLSGLLTLPPHPDSAEALEVLRQAGIRCIALSNGTAEGTRSLFANAGLTHLVERMIAVETVGLGKPRREVYLYAAETCGVEPADMCLVAAHPWDVHGAAEAGLATAYVARSEPFPSIMHKPGVTGATLLEVARELAANQVAGRAD